MVSSAICVLLGILLGTAAGFLPGIAVTTIVVIAYPFLQSASLVDVFVFYAVLVSTLQYYGSVSAIVFGVMGEASSGPAVVNGNELFNRGLSDEILTATATSSLIGSIFGLITFGILASNIAPLIALLSAKVKISIISLVLGLSVIWCKSRTIGIMMLMVGLVIGLAGVDIVPWSKVIYTAHSMFDGGIPIFPLMLGLIIIPTMVSNATRARGQSSFVVSKCSPWSRWAYLTRVEHLCSSIRGSIVGCVTGAIPGVSYSISSNLAESVERIFNKNSRSDDALKQNLYAAEAANNAGSIVVLAPFILFALPIIASEAMILGLLESNGYSYSVAIAFIDQYSWAIIGGLFVTNLMNWFISGFLYNSVITLFNVMEKYVYLVVSVACVSLSLYLGWSDHQLDITIISLLVSAAVGFIIKCDNAKLTFLFAYFTSAELLPEIYRQYLVYFS